MKLKNLFASDFSASHSSAESEAEFCCGKHAICMKVKLVQPVSEPVEYYDDEELDLFANRPSASYSESETGQFAEIFQTLRESDIPGWISCLRRRNIELPDALKELTGTIHS